MLKRQVRLQEAIPEKDAEDRVEHEKLDVSKRARGFDRLATTNRPWGDPRARELDRLATTNRPWGHSNLWIISKLSCFITIRTH